MASEKITAIVEEIKSLTILELADLVKEVEETFGVSAAAMTAAPAAGGAAAPAAAEEKTEFDVVLGKLRLQQARRYQGRPRDHRSRTQGSQGTRRGCSQDHQGRLLQGRCREHQEAAHRRRCYRRDQVIDPIQQNPAVRGSRAKARLLLFLHLPLDPPRV